MHITHLSCGTRRPCNLKGEGGRRSGRRRSDKRWAVLHMRQLVPLCQLTTRVGVWWLVTKHILRTEAAGWECGVCASVVCWGNFEICRFAVCQQPRTLWRVSEAASPSNPPYSFPRELEFISATVAQQSCEPAVSQRPSFCPLPKHLLCVCVCVLCRDKGPWWILNEAALHS